MDCDNFFDFDSLNNYVEFDKPLYSIISKRRAAKLVYLSPKQYIYKIAQGFGGLSYEDVVDSGAVIKGNIDKYAEAMKNGAKFPIGYYTKDGDSQEGRHRALAAMKLGCDKIPVIQFMRVSDKELSNVVNRLKDKSFEEIDSLFKKIGFKNGITRLGYNDLQRYIDYNLREARSIVREAIKESVMGESTDGSFIAYHGTDYDIDKFDTNFLSGDKTIQHHGAGIYFATSEENARMFGKNVYKVKISGKFIDTDNPVSDVDPDELIALMKLSDEDEWELEAQNYHPDPEVGLSIALDDALNYAKNEAEAFMRIQSGGWYMYDRLGYVKAMTKLGYSGMIVDAPSDWVNQKHIIVFNPDAVEIIEKVS